MRLGDFLEPQRRGRAVAAITASVTVVAAVIALNAGSAAGETPAERCARETATYNAAWESTWWASNPGNPGPPPPPPVPYVCHDPGEPTTTTPTAPPTAPGLQPTQAPGAGAQGRAGNAPGQLSEGGGGDIVPGPDATERAESTRTESTRTEQRAEPPAARTSLPLPAEPQPVQRPNELPLTYVRDELPPNTEPAPGSGPNANACSSCNKDELGNIVPGDVGPGPSRMDGLYIHWVIDSVEYVGPSAPPTPKPPVATCAPGDVAQQQILWSEQAINTSETSMEAGFEGKGASAAVKTSETKSHIQGLTLNTWVDCSKVPPAPDGMRTNFYQLYNKEIWTGHWSIYQCGLVAGCREINRGPASGVYYVPMASTYMKVEPDNVEGQR